MAQIVIGKKIRMRCKLMKNGKACRARLWIIPGADGPICKVCNCLHVVNKTHDVRYKKFNNKDKSKQKGGPISNNVSQAHGIRKNQIQAINSTQI